MGRWGGHLILLGILATRTGFLRAQETPRDLADLSLEELLKIEVTSVGRKEQTLLEAPAAISVLRGEDLQRSGIRSLAEALRLVPGMQVARIDANKWALTARGFNDRFANKLQVLVDGRVVYSPLFSGVLWEQQDTMIEDIERIEVIRGPGAAMWGSNAVNGVINVITKKARDTQGGLLVAGGGTEERAFGAVRWGDRSGDDLFYRVFIKHFDRDESYEGHDAWHQSRAGFRADWGFTHRDTLTVQGEFFHGTARGTMNTPILGPPYVQTFNDTSRQAGGHAIVRWERHLGDRSGLSLQLTYDHTRFTDADFGETRDTLDLDFQHRFEPLEGHDVVWGVGYRLSTDRVDNGENLRFDPDHDTVGLLSAFIQDEIALVGDRLRLTLGSRFEYNPYTHFEIQPGARLAWKPHDRHALWAAASRAVRMPSRTEDAIRINYAVFPTLPLPTEMSFFGDRDFKSEELIALEAGYRFQPLNALFLDLTVFLNLYDDLRTAEPGTPFLEPEGAPDHVVAPYFIDNRKKARSMGLEISADWQGVRGWKISAAYTLFRMHQELEDTLDPTAEEAEGECPRHQAVLRSSTDLLENLQFDAILRYTDVVPAWDAKSYIELDARLGWRITPDLEVSLVGQNLLHRAHLEAGPQLFGHQVREVERGAYLSITWKF